MLGFEAAVAALGLKANVSEAEHPLLCEGTRRQRGELALTLLSFYKDDPVKLARIMNKVYKFTGFHLFTDDSLNQVYKKTTFKFSMNKVDFYHYYIGKFDIYIRELSLSALR